MSWPGRGTPGAQPPSVRPPVPGSLAVPQGLGSDPTLPAARKPASVCVVDAARRPGSQTPCREQASRFIGSPSPPTKSQHDVTWAQVATVHTGGVCHSWGPLGLGEQQDHSGSVPTNAARPSHPWKEGERPSRRQGHPQTRRPRPSHRLPVSLDLRSSDSRVSRSRTRVSNKILIPALPHPCSGASRNPLPSPSLVPSCSPRLCWGWSCRT